MVLADVQRLDLDGRVVHALAPDGRELMLRYDRPYRTITYQHARDELAEHQHERE